MCDCCCFLSFLFVTIFFCVLCLSWSCFSAWDVAEVEVWALYHTRRAMIVWHPCFWKRTRLTQIKLRGVNVCVCVCVFVCVCVCVCVCV